MQSEGNLLTRDDTFLGVCEALGEDFRINPLWLRLGFGLSLLWNPTVVIGTYLGLGLLVAISRFLAPNPRRASAVVETGAAPAAETVETEAAEIEPEPLAAAA